MNRWGGGEGGEAGKRVQANGKKEEMTTKKIEKKRKIETVSNSQIEWSSTIKDETLSGRGEEPLLGLPARSMGKLLPMYFNYLYGGFITKMKWKKMGGEKKGKGKAVWALASGIFGTWGRNWRRDFFFHLWEGRCTVFMIEVHGLLFGNLVDILGWMNEWEHGRNVCLFF